MRDALLPGRKLQGICAAPDAAVVAPAKRLDRRPRDGYVAMGNRRAARKRRFLWMGGRVVEGGGLLNRYTVNSRIEGSNPSPSATINSLLYKCSSGRGMDSNVSRNVRGLRLMRPAVVAC